MKPLHQVTALNDKDRALLARVRATVPAVEPAAQVILYGSRARGDAAPDSDWDTPLYRAMPFQENVTREGILL